MNVSSGEDLSMGRCFSNKADMPMICFCQDVGVAVSEIALYILKLLAYAGSSSPSAMLGQENDHVTGRREPYETYLGHRNPD